MPAVIPLEIDTSQIARAEQDRVRAAKKWHGDVIKVRKAYEMVGRQSMDSLSGILADLRKIRVELKTFHSNLDRTVQGLEANRKSSEQWGKGLRDNKRDTKSAADKLNLLAQRQEVANRLMKQGGVSAKAGGAAARLYAKDLDKLGDEGLDLARNLDRAQKETLELSAAQRKGAGTATRQREATSSLIGKLVGLAVAYGAVRVASRQVLGGVEEFGAVRDALISVKKTTDLTAEGVRGLNKDVTELATGPVPLLKTELLAIATAAGQVGVRGRENLAEQIELFGRLKAATKDIAPEEAVVALTRLRNVQGELIDVSRTQVNVLVRLGNEFAANEAEIIAHTSEVGRATAQFKIGSVQALALGAALAAMGSRAESGGTAIGRTMREIQGAVTEGGAQLRAFADIAGTTAEDFSRQWGEDNVAAMTTFLRGLARFGQDSATELKKVGLGTDRIAKVLPVLAENLGLLERAQATAADEAQRLTALNKESSAAFDEQNADLARLTNSYKAQQEALGAGLSPALREAAGDWADFFNSADATQFGQTLGVALQAASVSVLFLADNVDVLTGAFLIFLALKVPIALAAIETAFTSLAFLIFANPLAAFFVAVGVAIVAVNVGITRLKKKWQTEINAMVKDAQKLADSMVDFQDLLRSGNQERLNNQLKKTRGEIAALTEEAAKLGEAKDLERFAEGTSKRWKELGVEIDDVTRVLLRHEVEELKTVAALERLGEASKAAGQSMGGLGDEAGDASGGIVKVSDALEKLQSQAVRQQSVVLAVKNLGVSAAQASQIVGTLVDIQKESGVEGLTAAEAVRNLLSQGEDASVLAVTELVTKMTEVADLQDRRLETLREIARLEAQAGLPDVRPIGPVALPPGFQGRDFGAFGGIPSGADVAEIKAAEKAAKRLEALAIGADMLRDAFGGLDGIVGEIARALPGFLKGLKALRSGAPGGKKAFAAGAINLATGLASEAFGFTGQRGPGEFGEDISGDFSDVGGQVGEIAGAIVGSIVGPLGTVLGAAIGKFLGTIIGGLIKSGADEVIVGATQVGDQIQGVVSRAEGPLGELGAQMAGAFEEIFSALEGVIGGSISIQASEIIGGPEIKAAGEAAVIKLRNGVFRLFMDGVVQEFGTIDEALEAATLGLLAKAEFGEGVSEAVVAALTSGAGSLEELDDRLKFALNIDKVLSGLGPVATSLDEINALREIEKKKLQEINLPLSIANQLLDKRIGLLRDQIQAELKSVAGISDHAATLERLTAASREFNAGLDAERASRESQLAVLRDELAARESMGEALATATEGGRDFEGMLVDLESGGLGQAERAGRGLGATMETSARSIDDTRREIAALEAGLEDLGGAIDPDLIAQGIAQVAQSAADNLFGLLAEFEGFAIDNAAAEAARNALARGRIAIEIQGLRDMLASAVAFSDLSRAALESAIAAGETLLAGDFKLRRPGGGGRRQEAQREAEAAAEAQDRAAESFAEAMLGFRQELSATSEEQRAFSDRVDEFRELAEKAGAPLDELNQGLQMMAEIDIRAIGEAWATTAAQFRASDLEGAVRNIGQRRTAAIEGVNIREDLSPEAAREAKQNIRQTTRREFEALGKAALKGLGGALSNLTRTGKETVRTINFLVRNADKLGLSLSQIGRTVRDQVLGPLLALARSEAERVGDTEEAARIAARQGKIAIALKTAELILARQMLEAAGALSRSLGRLIDDTIARLSRPTATDPGRVGGLTGGRTAARSSSGRSGVDLGAIIRDIEGILEGFRRARLGPTATSAAALAQQLKDVRDQARLANFDLGKVSEAFAVARAEFVKTALDAIGPAEALNASVSALDEVEQRFVDVVAGLMIVGAGADALADAGDRLVLASDAIEDNLKVGIRQEIEELRNLTAPSNKVVFDESQARFEELAATALDESLTNAQRAEALEALADASQAFRTETIERFGAGPGTQPILDAILATLEQVEAADILVTTDRQILEAQAASLAQIDLTTAAQPTAASSAASFSSLETSIASLGGGIIDPGLLATLMDNLNGTQMQIEATISGLVDVLGADIFADVVEAIGALPFADLVNSLDAAGLDFGGFVDQLGGIDLSDLDFGEIVDALGPLGPIVQQLGAENFAEIVAALAPLLPLAPALDEGSPMISKLASMRDSLRAGGGIQVKLGKGLDFTGRNTGPGSVQGELRSMGSILAGLQSFHSGGIAQSTGLALLQRDERVLSPADTVRFDAGQFLAPVAPAGGDNGDLVAEVRSLKAQVAELTRITRANAARRVEIANMEAGQADAALGVAQQNLAANQETAEHIEGEGDQAR